MKKNKLVLLVLTALLATPSVTGLTYAATNDKAAIVSSALKNAASNFNLEDGMYGSNNDKQVEKQDGSVQISGNGVNYENAIVNGDLIIQGNNVNLTNVTVKGKIIIAISAKNAALNLSGVKADEIDLEGNNAVVLNLSNKSSIKTAIIANQEAQINSSKDSKVAVQVQKGNKGKLTINGYVSKLDTSAGSKVILRKGKIDTVSAHGYSYITAYADTSIATMNGNGNDVTVSGAGTIKTSTNNSNPEVVAAASRSTVVENIGDLNISYNGTDSTISLPTAGSDGATISWSSSNASAIDPATGKVNRSVVANDDKSVTLTATITKGGIVRTKDFAVTVKNSHVYVSGVTVSPKTVSVDVYASANLAAVIAPDNATTKNYTWSSSDSSIATVDNTGKVTGVAPGTATITAAAEGGKSDAATVTVNDPDVVAVNKAISEITFDTIKKDNADSSKVTTDLNLVSSLADVSGVNIKWQSDKADVITNDGKVSRPNNGSDADVKLTVIAEKNGKKASKDITLKVLAKGAQILSASVDKQKILAGAADSLEVNIGTEGIADGTADSAELVKPDGTSLSTPVKVSGTVTNNASKLTLSIPNTLAEGTYNVKVLVDGVKTANTDKSIQVSKITIDGDKDVLYKDIDSVYDGVGDSWGAKLGKLSYNYDDKNLYVYFNFATVNSGNNVYFLIDNTSANGLSDFSKDMTTAWGDLKLSNSLNFNTDFITWGWRDGAKWNLSGANKITNGAGSDVKGQIEFKQSADNTGYEFKIPFSVLNAAKGDKLQLITLFGKNDSDGGLHSSIPGLKMDGSGKITDIDKAITIELK